MECDWKAGDEIICVDSEPNEKYSPNFMGLIDYIGDMDGLQLHKIYTVKDIYVDDILDTLQVCVKEINRGIDGTINRECGYDVRRFRKLQTKKTDISIFKSMLNKSPKQNEKEIEESKVRDALQEFAH